jgi:hypothetical protein
MSDLQVVVSQGKTPQHVAQEYIEAEKNRYKKENHV